MLRIGPACVFQQRLTLIVGVWYSLSTLAPVSRQT